MRRVVFLLCLIADAVKVKIDANGTLLFSRPRTSIAGAGGIADVLEKIRSSHTTGFAFEPRNRRIAVEGLDALASLVASSRWPPLELLAREGGIAVVFEALRAYECRRLRSRCCTEIV